MTRIGANSSAPTATSSSDPAGQQAHQIAATARQRLEFQQTGLLPKKAQPPASLSKRASSALAPVRQLLELTQSDPALRESVMQALQLAGQREAAGGLPATASRR